MATETQTSTRQSRPARRYAKIHGKDLQCLDHTLQSVI